MGFLDDAQSRAGEAVDSGMQESTESYESRE
jgi:hypothetical protein